MATDISSLVRTYRERAKARTDTVQNCTLTRGSNLVTVASTASLAPGMIVSGRGIHADGPASLDENGVKIVDIIDVVTIQLPEWVKPWLNGSSQLTFSSVSAQVALLRARLSDPNGLSDEIDAGDWEMTQLQTEGGSSIGKRNITALERAAAIGEAIDQLTKDTLEPACLTIQFFQIPR